jgi:toxin ParE1/3/4
VPQSKRGKGIFAWAVRFTQSAEMDLTAILDYIAERDGIEQALALLQIFQQGRASLATFPSRGHFPPELAKLHIMDFREIHVSVYRMVYQADETEQCVYIHAVLDVRRHVDTLLRERLLREDTPPE